MDNISLDRLPSELLHFIIQDFNPQQRRVFSLVCRLFRDIVKTAYQCRKLLSNSQITLWHPTLYPLLNSYGSSLKSIRINFCGSYKITLDELLQLCPHISGMEIACENFDEYEKVSTLPLRSLKLISTQEGSLPFYTRLVNLSLQTDLEEFCMISHERMAIYYLPISIRKLTLQGIVAPFINLNNFTSLRVLNLNIKDRDDHDIFDFLKLSSLSLLSKLSLSLSGSTRNMETLQTLPSLRIFKMYGHLLNYYDVTLPTFLVKISTNMIDVLKMMNENLTKLTALQNLTLCDAANEKNIIYLKNLQLTKLILLRLDNLSDLQPIKEIPTLRHLYIKNCLQFRNHSPLLKIFDQIKRINPGLTIQFESNLDYQPPQRTIVEAHGKRKTVATLRPAKR